MAVAFDTSAESHALATGSISEASFSFSFTPGSAKGILVFVMGLVTSADDSTAVSWGGVSLTAVSGGFAADTATEPMSCKAWFLGDAAAIAGRADNTLLVTRNNNTNELWACAITVTADAGMNTEVYTPGIVLLQENGTLAAQSVTDGSPGTNSWRFAGIASGLATPPVADASTDLFDFDTGNQTASVVREGAAGQGARNVGFFSGTSDDRAAVHLAVREVAASGDATATPATVAATAAVPAATGRGAASTSPSTVAATGTVPAATARSDNTGSPAAVAGIAAIPAPTVRGTAVAAPSAVAAIGAVLAVAAGSSNTASPPTVAGLAATPAPTARGAASASPSTVVATASVPAPTARGAAVTSPATVAAIGAIPDPVASGGAGGDGTANPATVAAVAAIPAAIARGAAIIGPATVGAVAAVPAPIAQGAARTTPATVAALAAVPAPTASSSNQANPATVAAIATVPASVGRGAGVASPLTVAAIVTIPAPSFPGLVIPTFITEGDADATSTYLEGDGGKGDSLEGGVFAGAGLES